MAKQHRLKEIADMVHTGTFRQLKAAQRVDAELGEVNMFVAAGPEQWRDFFDLEVNIEDDRRLYRITVHEVGVREGG